MSNKPHVADAESTFFVLNVTPDFCKVGGRICAFDTYQTLVPEEGATYATKLLAHGEKVLLTESIVDGVKGNAGKGVKSGVSGASGHVLILDGAAKVIAEGRKVARHGDPCTINVKVG